MRVFSLEFPFSSCHISPRTSLHRHESDYGVSDRFQLAFYLADWRYEESADSSGMRQLTSRADEPNFQIRTIIAIDF